MMPESPLTEREVEILQQVATGANNRQIAQQLGISANTVKVHLRNIFEKTGAASRTGATVYAIQSGLVEGVESTLVTPVRPWWQRNWVITGGVLVLTMVALLVGLLVNRAGSPPENLIDLEQLEGERWQELAPMPTARRGLAVAAYDGQIYAIAGETEDGVTNVVERYDPATDTWETLPPKPTAVTDVQAAVIGGKIYVPGGRLASGAMTDVLEVYDPRIQTWSEFKASPRAVSMYALASYDGQIFLFGGWDGKVYSEGVYRYSPGTDEWSQASSLEAARGEAKAVSSDSGIYLIGGRQSTGLLPDFELYRPSLENAGQNPWQDLNPLPVIEDSFEAVGVADIIFIINGKSTGSRIFEYVIRDSAWRFGDNELPISVTDLGAVSLGEYIYLMSGELRGQEQSKFYRYRALYRIFLPFSTN